MGRGSSETLHRGAGAGSAVLYGAARRRGDRASSENRSRRLPAPFAEFNETLRALGLSKYVEDVEGFSGGANWLAAATSLPENWKFKSAKHLWRDYETKKFEEKLGKYLHDINEGKAVDCEVSDVIHNDNLIMQQVAAEGSDDVWTVSPSRLTAATRCAAHGGNEVRYFKLLPESGGASPWLSDERPNAVLVGFSKINEPVAFVDAALVRDPQ